MLFQDHDFRHNFSGAIDSKDLALNKDLMISEISYQIVHNRKEFIEMMNLAGFNVTKETTDAELVDLLIDNIAANKKLSTGLAYLIVSRHEGKNNETGKELSNTTKKAGEVGKEVIAGDDKKSSGSGWSSASGIISSVANLGSSVFDYFGQREQTKAQKESDKMALMQSMIAMRTAEQQKGGGNTALWVVGGILAVGILGLVAWLALRKKPNLPTK